MRKRPVSRREVLGAFGGVAAAALLGASTDAIASVAAADGQAIQPIADPEWLRSYLADAREAYELPALAASVVIGDRVAAASALGRRMAGADERVRRDDRFQAGSITKPVTATLIGALVDEGKLRWDLTVEEMFPDLQKEMQQDYRKVTVIQLLAHVSGLPYQPKTPEPPAADGPEGALKNREAYVRAALADPPEARPGTKFIYSGGAILVAHYAERVTKQPYEQLVADRVFKKLGMTTADFGPLATPPGKVDGVWEHHWEAGKLKALPPTARPTNWVTRACVGGLNCSVADLGRFAAAHLQGARGAKGLLQPETFRTLHIMVPPGPCTPAWFRAAQRWARGPILWHSGSNMRNYAIVHIVPEEDYATCVMTNAWDDDVQVVCNVVNRYLVSQIKKGRLDSL